MNNSKKYAQSYSRFEQILKKKGSRQKAYMEKHRDNKAYERFKHMPDYGKGVQNYDK